MSTMLAVISADFGDQGFSNLRAFRAVNGRWYTEDGESVDDKYVTSVRVLPVLDIQAKELVKIKQVIECAYDLSVCIGFGTDLDELANELTSQILGQVKPDEPIGIGATVVDIDGTVWVKTNASSNTSKPWVNEHNERVSWDHILITDVDNVLSYGVSLDGKSTK